MTTSSPISPLPVPIAMLRRIVLSALLLLLLPLVAGRAQSPTALDPNGRAIRLDSLRDGSYTVPGGFITVGDNGVPMLVDSTHSLPPHSDTCWSEQFAPNGIIGRVTSIVIYKNDVYVAGAFLIAGNTLSSNIVRWSNTTRTWNQLQGTGGEGTDEPIYAMIAHNDDLFVGGSFTLAGGIESPGIARYSMAAKRWFKMGEGILRTAIGQIADIVRQGSPYAFAIQENTLYVGGEFLTVNDQGLQNLAEYDIVNNVWRNPCRASSQSPNRPVYALTLRDSVLYIGGAFTSVGGVNTNHVARLDLRTGLIASMAQGFDQPVYALTSHNGQILAGGDFTTSGTTPIEHLAAWNGNAWSEFGGGTSGTVHKLLSQGSTLYVAGIFDRSGNVSASSIASYNNGVWNVLASGLTDTTLADGIGLAYDNGLLYAGGRFNAAGDVNVRNVAVFDGTRWSALGGTPATNFNGTDGPVYAIARSGSNIFVAGDFLNAGGIPANRVARFDLAAELWSPLAQGANAPGSLTRALAVDDDGFLYLGGIFSSISGVPALGIARWDGSAWNALGSGLAGTTPYVFALLAASDSIIVGGAFETAGGAPSQKVAIWRRAAQQWQSVGTGITGDTVFSFVSALGLHQGRLYAGGLFSKVGTTAARNVAQFDGSLWQPMAKGLNGRVSALASMADGLYAGGEFTKSDTAAMASIARWDGLKWSSVAGGTNGIVNALLPLEGNKLLVLGDFTTADTITTRDIALWSPALGTWKSADSSIGAQPNVQVRAGLMAGEAFYFGGDFTRLARVRTNFVGRVSLGEASALGSDPTIGLDGAVEALEYDGRGQLFAGGYFGTAGGSRVNGIARWSGTHWLGVGEPMRNARDLPNERPPVVDVRALARRADGTMIAAGIFDSIGTRAAGGVGIWDGVSWKVLNGGVRDGNLRGAVNAAADDGTGFIIGGRFTTAGGVAAFDLARWDGTAWTAITSGGTRKRNGRGEIGAVGVMRDGYVVGGSFDTIGTVAARSLAFIDRASGVPRSILRLSEGMSVTRILVAHDTAYIACNSIDTVYILDPNGVQTGFTIYATHALYSFDGTNVKAIDTSSGGLITALYYSNRDQLYVGGTFNYIAATNALNLGHRDTNGIWQGFEHGFQEYIMTIFPRDGVIDSALSFNPGAPFALAVHDDTVWAGGSFSIVGARPSLNIARWTNCDGSVAAVNERGIASPSLPAINLQLWPNPTTERATLRVRPTAPGPIRVDLIDARGRTCRTIYNGRTGGDVMELAIDVEGLAPGSYFCRAWSGGSVAIAPLVLSR